MANYKEAAITGTKWQRANKITISNPHVGLPSISFAEEDLTVLSDGRMTNTPLSTLDQAFDNPATVFNLVNPLDGTVIGTATYQDVYVMMFSIYAALAAARDAAPAP